MNTMQQHETSCKSETHRRFASIFEIQRRNGRHGVLGVAGHIQKNASVKVDLVS